MKAYVSSSNVYVAQCIAYNLMMDGVGVVSDWHANSTFDDRAVRAAHNLSKIDSADVLVLVADNHHVQGGKFVEAGYALGKGKLVVVLGQRENITLHYAGFKQVDDIPQLLEFLNDYDSASRQQNCLR